jgi:7-carboxy-7-deazaguanine synthase
MTIEAIVAAACAHPARYVVVTGGEPMIAPQITPLTEALRQRGYHITIETAGTVYAPVVCDLMSVSPKLANSTPEGRWAEAHDRLRIQPDVLRKLISRYEYQLKFVIRQPEDLREVRALTASLKAFPDRVVLMPEGTEAAALHERSLWLAEICKREGFRFTPRLHVDLWGNRRGV